MMKVVATQELNLELNKTEYKLQFSFRKKNGVDGDFWFTPSGLCKLWIGCLYTQPVGKIDKEVYENLIKELKENKTEFFKDGSNYYTTFGENAIAEVSNANQLLYKIEREWDARKVGEMWVDYQE